MCCSCAHPCDLSWCLLRWLQARTNVCACVHVCVCVCAVICRRTTLTRRHTHLSAQRMMSMRCVYWVVCVCVWTQGKAAWIVYE